MNMRCLIAAMSIGKYPTFSEEASEKKQLQSQCIWLCRCLLGLYRFYLFQIDVLFFSTTNKSIHGHPEGLGVPHNEFTRDSIAMYYYTRNSGKDVDFEGGEFSFNNLLWYTRFYLIYFLWCLIMSNKFLLDNYQQIEHSTRFGWRSGV